MSIAGLFDLGGRHAIVTGASRGLGLQIAQALGLAGARLLISARARPMASRRRCVRCVPRESTPAG
ncbi:MAG: SDR family NAD(P)-dependent oxidoreductase [Burkholderiaceae bacterium]